MRGGDRFQPVWVVDAAQPSFVAVTSPDPFSSPATETVIALATKMAEALGAPKAETSNA